MVDLTRHPDPEDPDKLIVRARLLDLVPGRSGTVYRNWLIERGDAFRAGVQVATLDPFHGYKNAIDDQFDEAASVLDAFHVVKLGGQALDEIRRRVQQAIHGHRGRKGDPLYSIRNILRLGLQHLSEKQRARIEAAFAADERHDEVHIAWQAVHQAALRVHRQGPSRRQEDRAQGHRLLPVLPDPGDRPPWADPAQVAGRVPRLFRHRPFQQRWDRGDQRADRAAPPNRARLSQQAQLPATDAPHRRRADPMTPHPGPMSPQTDRSSGPSRVLRRRITLHLPKDWPWETEWAQLFMLG